MPTPRTILARRSAMRALRGALLIAAVACSRADASDTSFGGAMLSARRLTASSHPNEEVQIGVLSRATAGRLIEKDSLFANGGAWWDMDVESMQQGERCAEVLESRGRNGTGTMAALAQASGYVRFIDSEYVDSRLNMTVTGCKPIRLHSLDSIPKSKQAAKVARANEYVSREPSSMLETTLTLWIRAIRPSAVEVTGIVQEAGAASAQAEFLYRNQVVPKYQSVLRLPPDRLKPGRGVATFRRYDDGWRLLSLNW